MRLGAYWLGVCGGLALIGAVIEMVRRRYLRGRFALVWLLVGVGAVILALYPPLLGQAATALGVQIPLNLLLFLGNIAMLIMILQLSADAGRLHERTRRLAEEIALLRAAVTTLSSAPRSDERTATASSSPGATEHADSGLSAALGGRRTSDRRP